MDRRQFLLAASTLPLHMAATAQALAADPAATILIGLDAEFRDSTSTSGQAIRAGALLAIEDINARGGLLDKRMLALVERDNRSVPARGVDNVRELAAMPNLVAYLCGKFSPVTVQQIPIIHQHGLILLNPWSAADSIIDNGYQPNYAFRIGLRDSWAIPLLLNTLRQRGVARFGLMVPMSEWGRSNLAATERYLKQHTMPSMVGVEYHFWGEGLIRGEQYENLLSRGAQAIVLVANEPEGASLVRYVAERPPDARLPILSHWGIAGGDFPRLCGPALQAVDLEVVQTFSFEPIRNERMRKLADRARVLSATDDATRIPSVVGLAHAHDLVHLLAQAITLAGRTERSAVRDALEHLPPHDGLIRHYARPFTRERHEGLSPEDLFLARYQADGRLLRSDRGNRPYS